MAADPQEEFLHTSHSPEETRALGRAVGRHVQAGDLITLRGDLGAGKTTFVQGLAEGMEVTEPVVSPSFTLLHEHPGRVKLYHLDLYRLVTADLPDIGLDDVLGAEAVVAVEWSERLPADFTGDALEMGLGFGDTAEARRIVLRATGPRGRRLLAAAREAVHADAGR